MIDYPARDVGPLSCVLLASLGVRVTSLGQRIGDVESARLAVESLLSREDVPRYDELATCLCEALGIPDGEALSSQDRNSLSVLHNLLLV